MVSPSRHKPRGSAALHTLNHLRDIPFSRRADAKHSGRRVFPPPAIAIAKAAKRLDELREAWLNPPDLVRREPEVVPGFPDRLLPVSATATAILKKRTLTNLYNERPTWLANAHRDLDAAVAAAYGWPEDIAEDDALARLLELNKARAGATPPPAGPRRAAKKGRVARGGAR